MATRREMLGGAATGIAAVALLGWRMVSSPAEAAAKGNFPVHHTDAEWKKLLTPAQYQILREDGTEAPFSSPLLKEHRAGTFVCAGCSNPVYSSKTKFDSGTGWPSFWAPISKTAIGRSNDSSLGMDRTEVHCARCGGHLGHVFDDGPKPTGLRYCMDGVAMKFFPAQA